MKKYLLALIIIVSPLMVQEKNTEMKDYKRPVFGLNFDLSYTYI
ncbi:MAG: hypothetical protein ACRCV0_04200 [Brevinema sp.]